MLKDQRILVTGATGQVARPLAEYLSRDNEVWAAARFSDQSAKEELEAQGINTVYFSMWEEDLSRLPDVDYVFHCGCNTDPKSPEEGVAQNAEGTGFLMQRYRSAKGFFHMSSSSVYALPEDPAALVKESDPLGGFSSYSPHYAMSKQSVEAVVRFLARQFKLPTIIARLDVAYGRHGHGGAPVALVQFLRHGMPFVHASRGDSYCTPIHETDIALQVESLIQKATVPATTVNLGGDEVVTMEEMYQYLAELTGLEVKIVDKEKSTWEMTALDNTLRKSLAGPCTISWKEGLREVLQSRHPDLVSN
jgi:nucleoside-diphosphate-sugar epimerase